MAQYVELLSSLDDVQLAALDEAKLQEMGVMAADDRAKLLALRTAQHSSRWRNYEWEEHKPEVAALFQVMMELVRAELKWF